MGDIINLRGVRKAKARQVAKVQAAANREQSGRTLEQREQVTKAAEAAARKIDGAKLEP